MNIHLEVMMYMVGTLSLRRGSFQVVPSEFKKDPDFTAAVVAYQWIQKIKFETGNRDDTQILKVIYDGENDITELVKKVKPVI